MCTDATFDMAMLSSLLPKKRDFTRLTRCGLTTSRVGNRKLPCVQRLALNVSVGPLSAAMFRPAGVAGRYTHSSAPFFHTQM
jgi:hypothetical protein